MENELIKLLYIDDEKPALFNFEQLFQDDFDVYTASSAAHGIEILAKVDIQIIICDQRMPDKTGIEFFADAAQQYPDTVRILLTAYSEAEVVIDAINQGQVYQYITKPFETKYFKNILDKASQNWRLKKENKLLITQLQKKNEEYEVINEELRQTNEELCTSNIETEKSKNQIKYILQTAMDGFWMTNMQGYFINVNDAYCNMSGYTETELLNMHISDVEVLENKEDVELHIKNIIENGRDRFVSKHKRRDGSIYDVEISAIYQTEYKNAFVVFVRDITAQKQFEKALIDSEERFQLLFNKAPLGYQSLDINGHFIDVNQQWLDTLGYERDEVIDKWFGDFLTPMYQDGFRKRFPIFKAQGHIHSEFEMVHKNGSILFIAFDGRIGNDNTGNFKQTHCILQDITEKRKAERKLIESETQFRNLANSSTTLIWTSGTDKLCNYFNEPWLKFTGRTLEQEMGNGWAEGVHPDDFDRCLATYVNAFDKQEAFEMDYRLRHTSGEYRWILDMGTPNFNSKNEFVGYIGNCYDINERKIIEDTQTFLLHISNPDSDDNFFDSLAIFLSKSLDMEYVCIDILDGDELTAQTLAIYNEGNFDPNISYALKDTPCGEVVENHICCYPSEVRSLFPNDPALEDIKAESYIGTTLRNSDGKAIGLIAVIGQKPLHNNKLATSVLKLVSLRAAGKLEATLVEKKLRESQEKYYNLSILKNAILESPEGIIVFALDANYCYLDFTLIHQQTMKTIWGVDIEIGCNMLSYISNETDGRKAKINFDRVLNGESFTIIEEYGDEKLIRTYYENRYSPIYDDNKHIIGLAVFVIDITDRRQAEEALKESEERFTLAMKASSDGLFDWDLETNEIYYAPAWKKMLGYEDHELPNDFSVWETTTDPEDVEKSWELQQKLITKQINRFVLEFKMKHKVGHWVDILSRAKAIFNKDGKAIRIVGTHTDISERKIAEQELIKTKEKAQESDRLKSAFLANMSHEIRTPMNGILGFADLLKDPELSGEQQQQYIKIIEKSGARMLNIFNDIVDISKIEAGLMKVEMKESNVNQQIDYIYTFFKPEVEAKGMQLSINTKLSDNKALITTDREKLYAILTNLVKNAIKYSKEGAIEIGYILKTVSQVDERLVLSEVEVSRIPVLEFYVKDSGIGIPKDRQQAIFERFVQADIEDEMARQGAGLGLTITKSYVEMLGGKIWVESEEGVGSCFYFTLPYIAYNEEITKVSDDLFDSSNSAKNLKILIAEDDETSETLLSILLVTYSKDILKVKNGMDAIEICRQNPDIDLIMMDIRLPLLGGYEATKQIREFNKEVIIIAQTAFGLSGDREKALEAGCNDYISKPIKKNLLKDMIDKYFKK